MYQLISKRTALKSPGITAFWRWALCIGYAGLVAYLSLLPADNVKGISHSIPHADKIVHFGLYGVFAGLLAWTWQIYRLKWQWILFIAVVIPAMYGIIMEVLQWIWSERNRHFSLVDIAMNTAGAFFFSGAYIGLVKIKLCVVTSEETPD